MFLDTPAGRAAAEALKLFGVANHIFGGVFVKQTRIAAGTILVQHRHLYDHLSFLVSGVVELDRDGRRERLEGPAVVEVAAGAHHGVKAVTDAVWLCIHATDAAEAEEAEVQLVAPADDARMQAIARGLGA